MVDTRRKAVAALVSVLSNLLLTLAKVVAAILSGSISVLSEAVHSAGDIVASLLAFASVRVSDRPADPEHPFGHGKVESFAGLAEALLLIGAAGYVGWEAVHRLSHGRTIEVDIGLWVVGGTAVWNVFVGRYLSRVAKETDSEALAADAAHITADVVTSMGVFIGLALVKITNNPIYDPIVALMLTAWILWMAGKIAYTSFSLLIDTALPADEVELIADIIRTHPRVLDWHQLRTRKSGSHRHADVHVLVDDNLSLVESHRIAEEIEDRVRSSLPNVSINIHMEPYLLEKRHRRDVHGEG